MTLTRLVFNLLLMNIFINNIYYVCTLRFPKYMYVSSTFPDKSKALII